MARNQNRNDFFPPIKTSYEESYGSARGSPQPIVQYRRQDNAVDRISELENRLEYQERTTQQLVDKAVQIKQELIENLGLSQGTWQEERGARELLQEHVRTITAVIRQMNSDIKKLDDQIKEKESSLQGTGNVLRKIETSQVTAVGDLRGRVGRCDAAIAKLAADLRQNGEGTRLLNSELQAKDQKIHEKIQNLELKNQELMGRLDKINSESSSGLKLSAEEAARKAGEAEHRSRVLLEELRHQLDGSIAQAKADRDAIDSKHSSRLDQSFAILSTRMEKLEENVNSDKHHRVILDRLENLESEFKSFQKERANFEKELERKVTMNSDRLYRQQIDDLARFKREVRDGFAAIHETINNMKSVVEGKQKLSEENLRKEMAQLRKMVVLI